MIITAWPTGLYMCSILFNTQMNDAEINVQIYEQIYAFISKFVITFLR